MIHAEVLESSKQVLNIKSKEVNVLKVMSYFLKGDITDQKRVESKNNILVHLFKNLEVAPPIPVRHTCTNCEGRGFNPVFFDVVEERCEACKGTGWKIAPCTRCNGTGLIGDVPCYTCLDRRTGKGRGTYLYKKTDKHSGKKCLICGPGTLPGEPGRGKVKKLIQRDSNIKEVIICKQCDGTGINEKIGTPVLNTLIAEKLKNHKVSTKSKVKKSEKNIAT